MQLGTRWAVGEQASASLPAAVSDAVTAVERELAATGVETDGWRWTLTWLEGRPIVELDDGTVIHYDPAEESAAIAQPAETDPGDAEER
ncbi:hypothetical protein ATY41_06815 [Leifsonia xyli subsp. xyli]|uniref:Fe-S oxidoreductase n=2 Tax=Leifsonia xyli subsp. xyli TaxID=59736 RepID=Q6AFZ5_LEIXX|nr:hypothetical protein [Leifsonia xyli]AAT88700.1 hypothetical protein Lxx07900 [Leifsonia xyli subsp. xyli str. CTCB07]ODA91096.1 hypothetical protein ATY41_06815 [Leifsonia xyli subsp. xyli]